MSTHSSDLRRNAAGPVSLDSLANENTPSGRLLVGIGARVTLSNPRFHRASYAAIACSLSRFDIPQTTVLPTANSWQVPLLV